MFLNTSVCTTEKTRSLSKANVQFRQSAGWVAYESKAHVVDLKGLVTLLAFLGGCADSATCTCANTGLGCAISGISNVHVYQYIFVGSRHVTAESAQASNVTRPFPVYWWGLGTRLLLHLTLGHTQVQKYLSKKYRPDSIQLPSTSLLVASMSSHLHEDTVLSREEQSV